MEFIQNVLKFLDTRIEQPALYGMFHLICIAFVAALAIALCILWKKGIIKELRRVILVISVVAIVFELYKQINLSFGYENGITFVYPWHEFPWQVSTSAVVIGFIAGLSKGKIHKNLCAYLATYTFLAGAYGLFYPAGEFSTTLGISLHTMVTNGLMVALAVLLLYSGHVPVRKKTILHALPIFVICVSLAIAFNEVAHLAGINELGAFSAFGISPYCESTVPVYTFIHQYVPFPFNVLIYVVLFTLAAFLMLLIPVGIKALAEKDFDADYAEEDARKAQEAREAEEKAELAAMKAYEAKLAAIKAEEEKKALEVQKQAEEEKAEAEAEVEAETEIE